MFTDVEFMTAKEKMLALKSWETFLKHGIRKKHFTKRLYNHLHLHCGFIANFDIHGFYSVYFKTGQDVERFFEFFCNYTVKNFGTNTDYNDLHTAIRQVYNQYQNTIKKQAEDKITYSVNLLDECIQRAKTDLGFAKEFLGKLRFHEGDLLCLKK